MLSDYYKYPLDLKRVFENKELAKCEIGESISQNLQLIIISHKGEHRYNPSFGCDVWELDFDLIMSIRVWEEKLQNSLITSINENENAIEKVSITVKVSEVEKRFINGAHNTIKRQVDIYIHAFLKETGETYRFHTQLFLSPISSY